MQFPNPAQTPFLLSHFISPAIEFQFPSLHLISPPLPQLASHHHTYKYPLPLSPPLSFRPKLSSPTGFAMKGARSKSDTKSAKLSVNKKPTKGGAAAARKSGKAAKDPNKPKRPASAFFVFMEEFREQYKKEHPKNKSVAAVGKAGGDKWKSLSEAEKAPFVAKADKRKVEYEKKMKAYNKEQAEGPKEEEESEKSMSEVNDDDEDDEEGSGEDDEDDE